MLTLTSFNSKFDQAMKGKAQLTEEEKRGFELFMMENGQEAMRKSTVCLLAHLS